MGTGSSNKRVVHGVVWASTANWGCQLLSFAIYTGLARLLDPRAFGLVAIAGVYVALIQVFVAQGFGMAIIQRSEVEREHLDSAFWIAVSFALLLCILSFLLGGQIARFFGEPRVAPIIRWLSFSFLFYALSAVPTAILTRELDFRALAIRSLVATIAGGTVGLAMAFLGYGVWSLVGQQLVMAVLGSLWLWSAVSWRPRLKISRRHLGHLYAFSLSIAGTDILWFFSQKSDQTMVGYAFGSVGLGPYSLASRLVTLVHDGIVGPVQSVALPAFSKLQSEPLKLERTLHKFCEMSSLVSFPVFAGIIAIAPDLVPLLFGSKWISAVPILQILALYGAVRAALGFVHPLLLSKGRPGLYLLLSVSLACLTLAGCLVAARWSPRAIAFSVVATMAAFAVGFLAIARSVLEIRVRPLLKTFVFPSLCSLFMMIAVALLQRVVGKFFGSFITLAVCVAAGAAIYSVAALGTRFELVKGIWGMFGNKLIPPNRAITVDTSPAVAEPL